MSLQASWGESVHVQSSTTSPAGGGGKGAAAVEAARAVAAAWWGEAPASSGIEVEAGPAGLVAAAGCEWRGWGRG